MIGKRIEEMTKNQRVYIKLSLEYATKIKERLIEENVDKPTPTRDRMANDLMRYVLMTGRLEKMSRARHQRDSHNRIVTALIEINDRARIQYEGGTLRAMMNSLDVHLNAIFPSEKESEEETNQLSAFMEELRSL